MLFLVYLETTGWPKNGTEAQAFAVAFVLGKKRKRRRKGKTFFHFLSEVE